jgi:hypothetical protein
LALGGIEKKIGLLFFQPGGRSWGAAMQDLLPNPLILMPLAADMVNF